MFEMRPLLVVCVCCSVLGQVPVTRFSTVRGLEAKQNLINMNRPEYTTSKSTNRIRPLFSWDINNSLNLPEYSVKTDQKKITDYEDFQVTAFNYNEIPKNVIENRNEEQEFKGKDVFTKNHELPRKITNYEHKIKRTETNFPFRINRRGKIRHKSILKNANRNRSWSYSREHNLKIENDADKSNISVKNQENQINLVPFYQDKDYGSLKLYKNFQKIKSNSGEFNRNKNEDGKILLVVDQDDMNRSRNDTDNIIRAQDVKTYYGRVPKMVYQSFLELSTHNSIPGRLYNSNNCSSTKFRTAPSVSNADIKYVRYQKKKNPHFKILIARYSCKRGFKFEDGRKWFLVCSDSQWNGFLPMCLERTSNRSVHHLPNRKPVDKPLVKVQECEVNQKQCDQLCFVLNGEETCSCYRGFQLAKGSCQDINECTHNNGNCSHYCQNLAGMYSCSCPKGYRLSADGYTCRDINECLLRNGHGPCQGTCTNAYGGYTCSCQGIPGTVLAADNHTCVNMDLCSFQNGGCSHICLNAAGTSFCSCPLGYTLDLDWKTCRDMESTERMSNNIGYSISTENK